MWRLGLPEACIVALDSAARTSTSTALDARRRIRPRDLEERAGLARIFHWCEVGIRGLVLSHGPGAGSTSQIDVRMRQRSCVAIREQSALHGAHQRREVLHLDY